MKGLKLKSECRTFKKKHTRVRKKKNDRAKKTHLREFATGVITFTSSLALQGRLLGILEIAPLATATSLRIAFRSARSEIYSRCRCLRRENIRSVRFSVRGEFFRYDNTSKSLKQTVRNSREWRAWNDSTRDCVS